MTVQNCTARASLLTLSFLAGCITVNVYFPVKALTEAADEFVDEVRPDDVLNPAGTGPAGTGSAIDPGESGDAASDSVDGGFEVPALDRDAGRAPEPALARHARLVSFELASIKTAHAADEDSSQKPGAIKIDVSSPKIKKIKLRVKERYKKLVNLYKQGRIGETYDGNLALRDVKGLGLKARRKVNTLLKAENADRKNLYTAIARENKIAASKIKDIGKLFSRSWQKKCKEGWWIEIKKGKWVKKKPEKPPKPAKAPPANTV